MDVGNDIKDEYKSMEDNNTECVRKQGLLRMKKKKMGQQSSKDWEINEKSTNKLNIIINDMNNFLMKHN